MTMICHVKSYPSLASLPSWTHLVLHHIVIREIDRQKIFSSYTYCRWKEARLLRMRMIFVCSIGFLTFLPASFRLINCRICFQGMCPQSINKISSVFIVIYDLSLLNISDDDMMQSPQRIQPCLSRHNYRSFSNFTGKL